MDTPTTDDSSYTTVELVKYWVIISLFRTFIDFFFNRDNLLRVIDNCN
jgi:hypothetical protein